MAARSATPFGDLLRAHRHSSGLTQSGLAVRAGLSPAAISALEQGTRRAPHRYTIALLAGALGLSDDERAALAASVSRRRQGNVLKPGTEHSPQAASAPPSALVEVEYPLTATRLAPPSPQIPPARLVPPPSPLAAGPQNLTDRRQTPRAALDRAYDLLDPGAVAVFRHLGVFSGSFTLEAVEAVALPVQPPERGLAADLSPLWTLDALTTLLCNGLIQSVPGDEELAPRVAMPQAIREYALERLAATGEEETLRRRHAAYYLALSEQAAPALAGPERALWLRRLETERDNLREALSWAAAANILP